MKEPVVEHVYFESHTSLAPSSPGVRAVHQNRSLSTLAGHVVSAKDHRTPILGARVFVALREVSVGSEGLYEVGLDELPLELELRVVARGFHPYEERLNWTSVATGGMILRDFYLTPSDQPAPARSPQGPPIAQPSEPMEDDDELSLDDEPEWNLDELDPDDDGIPEYEVEGWDESFSDDWNGLEPDLEDETDNALWASDDLLLDDLETDDALDLSMDPLDISLNR